VNPEIVAEIGGFTVLTVAIGAGVVVWAVKRICDAADRVITIVREALAGNWVRVNFSVTPPDGRHPAQPQAAPEPSADGQRPTAREVV
jgi:hypothetical protein